MKETFKKVLKAAAIASLLTGGVIASTSSIFAGKANANPVGFGGNVDPSCAVVTNFTSTANAYTKTVYTGSGGVSKLEKSDQASFNCNVDKIDVTAEVDVIRPTAPTQATRLQGVHTTTLSSNTGNSGVFSVLPVSLNSGTFGVAGWNPSNTGDITITVKSTWNPTKILNITGQELLDGDYTADVVITLAPS
ncbi:MAG: hypothetical protein HEQ10_21560 [Dolichospermum sp. DEX182a]|nr:hypothetical protein [Dolichospermum sp. DEX182a]